MTIAEAIQALSKRETFHSTIAKVISYDSTSLTCEVSPLDDSAKIIDVRVNAVEGGTGIIPVPTVGSIVIVSQTHESISFISMFSEIDSIQVVADSIKFNDGSLGGLIKINDLITKINNLENKVNDIITTLKTHVHTANNTPSTDFATILNLTMTVVGDLEDTKVIH